MTLWPTDPLQLKLLKVAVALLALAAALKILAGLWHFVRRRRQPEIHPRLQKYAGPDETTLRLAGQIVATSSTQEIPGYRIVRAIDALYVDGFRTPAEALLGLKAAAAEKGANAVINVRHERTSLGRCCASGDAVLVEPESPRQPRQAPTPPDAKADFKSPDEQPSDQGRTNADEFGADSAGNHE